MQHRRFAAVGAALICGSSAAQASVLSIGNLTVPYRPGPVTFSLPLQYVVGSPSVSVHGFNVTVQTDQGTMGPFVAPSSSFIFEPVPFAPTQLQDGAAGTMTQLLSSTASSRVLQNQTVNLGRAQVNLAADLAFPGTTLVRLLGDADPLPPGMGGSSLGDFFGNPISPLQLVNGTITVTPQAASGAISLGNLAFSSLTTGTFEVLLSTTADLYIAAVQVELDVPQGLSISSIVEPGPSSPFGVAYDFFAFPTSDPPSMVLDAQGAQPLLEAGQTRRVATVGFSITDVTLPSYPIGLVPADLDLGTGTYALDLPQTQLVSTLTGLTIPAIPEPATLLTALSATVLLLARRRCVV